jgi:TetR/AcrR family transcriptional regulator, regulator of cefoperazone and chloramphenicol sensitivity
MNDVPDTRARLLEAGLDHFGRVGFEGANIRAIATAAGANIAAINYHFGGKRGLYLAVANHIVEGIAATIGPLAAEIIALAARPHLTPADARSALRQFVRTAGRLLATSPKAERWARFILREQLDPTDAFDLIYDGIMGRMHRTLTALVAAVLELDRESETARLEAFSLLGQAMIFRFARAAVLKRLDWPTIGEGEADKIVAQLDRAVARLGARA